MASHSIVLFLFWAAGSPGVADVSNSLALHLTFNFPLEPQPSNECNGKFGPTADYDFRWGPVQTLGGQEDPQDAAAEMKTEPNGPRPSAFD